MQRIRIRATRALAAQLLAVLAVLSLGGVAAAISGGGYQPKDMDCTAGADAFNRTDHERGCHTVKANVESNGVRYGEVGIDQTPNGDTTPGLFGTGAPGSENFPHGYCAALNTGGTGGGLGNECGKNNASPRGIGLRLAGDTNKKTLEEQLTENGVHKTGIAPNTQANGLDVTLSADDNLDGGEHDAVDGRRETGTDGVQNGPSDGGSVQVHLRPAEATDAPSQTNLIPIAQIEAGSCADGICEDVTTFRHEIYAGDKNTDRDAANYDGVTWDPFNCSSGSTKDEKSCDSGKPGGPHNLREWKASKGRVYANPGVQIYEDPDAQASPIDPIAELRAGLGQDNGRTPLYPLPGTYVGSCGLILSGKVVAPGPLGACGS